MSADQGDLVDEDLEETVDDQDDIEHEDADTENMPNVDDLPTPDIDVDHSPDQDDDRDENDDQDDAADNNDRDDRENQTGQSVDVGSGSETMGDLYAKMLVQITNAMIEEHGRPDAEEVDVDAARQADVGYHFDRLMESTGIGEDMSPGQAVVLSSGMFISSNLFAKTGMAEQMAGDVL